MKGIILAGGTGSRLGLLTRVTNKHLLPVYDKPMIFYPLQTLKNVGISEILIISGPGHAGDFLNLLGSGKEWGVQLTYEVQDEAGGIAQALSLADDFADGESVAVILGDNIFQDNFGEAVQHFSGGACIFLKEVQDPERFGVAQVSNGKVLSIEEKPKKPKSNLAVTGMYVYDAHVFDIIKSLKPSHRGEYEITDVNMAYLRKNQLTYHQLSGYWSDAGTYDSLLRATTMVKDRK